MNLLIGINYIMKVLIIENSYKDLVNSRYPLSEYFINKGYSVSYACPSPPVNSGIYDLNISRNKLSPISLIKAIRNLIRIENKENIDGVLSFRLTSNILNYFSSFVGGKKNRVAVITGLGYAFVYSSYRNKILKFIISSFYKIAEKRIKVIVQNPDDLLDLGLRKGRVIYGSGITKPTIVINKKTDSKYLKLLFVGRLLKSKGVKYAINTYTEVKKYNVNTKLIIAGGIDSDNPDSISISYLDEIKKIEGVDYLSYVNNMQEVYLNSDILLFPSIYREGVPRAIIESLSFGLTIVTTNMPGCKETVFNNGICINNNFVVEATKYIISLSTKNIEDNSIESLKLFNNKFSKELIFPQYFDAISIKN